MLPSLTDYGIEELPHAAFFDVTKATLQPTYRKAPRIANSNMK